MNRRKFVRSGLVGSIALASVRALANDDVHTAADAPAPQAFELDELTIADVQKGMASGKYTSQSLTRKYLDRVKEIDKHGPAIIAVIETNPDAAAIARGLVCGSRPWSLHWPQFLARAGLLAEACRRKW